MKALIVVMFYFLTVTACNSKIKSKNTSTQSYDQSTIEASIKRGEIVYNDMCISCHLENGKGVPEAFPPLADADYLRENQTESIKAVKYGMVGKIIVNGITYDSAMSPLGLSDDEVADVMNYINNSWGNTINNFQTAEKVSKL